MIWLRHDFYKIVIVPHCLDGQQNEDETDVDCGGSCKPCQGMNLDNGYYLFFVNGTFLQHINVNLNIQNMTYL